jgi:activator of 2-hydroxyglutaryl-CoA dehydratase
MARRVGLGGRIAVVGGMAENAGFVDALRRASGVEVSVPEHAGFVCALGAAIAAAGGV